MRLEHAIDDEGREQFGNDDGDGGGERELLQNTEHGEGNEIANAGDGDGGGDEFGRWLAWRWIHTGKLSNGRNAASHTLANDFRWQGK